MRVRWAAREGGAAGKCVIAACRFHLVRGRDEFGRTSWTGRRVLQRMEAGAFFSLYGYKLRPGQGPVRLLIAAAGPGEILAPAGAGFEERGGVRVIKADVPDTEEKTP